VTILQLLQLLKRNKQMEANEAQQHMVRPRLARWTAARDAANHERDWLDYHHTTSTNRRRSQKPVAY
jgi:hypothetical protein